jgi:hypothetical protein
MQVENHTLVSGILSKYKTSTIFRSFTFETAASLRKLVLNAESVAPSAPHRSGATLTIAFPRKRDAPVLR